MGLYWIQTDDFAQWAFLSKYGCDTRELEHAKHCSEVLISP